MDALNAWFEDAKTSFDSLPFRTLRMVVMHPGKGPIIAKDADVLHDPASLTKLMNFYVACSMAKSAPANISISAHSVSVSKNNSDILKAGDTLPWNTALSAMMVASDNRAATAIAEALGSGPTSEARHREYVARMNNTARELGMQHSYFINASGMVVKPAPKKLPYSTASDMATLMAAIYRDFPEEAQRHLEASEVTYANRRFSAHHGLNTPEAPSFIGKVNDYILNSGSKTGFTNRALYGIATMVRGTSADESLVIVLMGVSPTTMRLALGLVEKDAIPPRTRKTKDPKSVDGDALRDALAQKIIHLWAKATKEADKIYIPTIAPAPEQVPALPKIPLMIPPLQFDDVLIPDFVAPLPSPPASAATATSEPARQ